VNHHCLHPLPPLSPLKTDILVFLIVSVRGLLASARARLVSFRSSRCFPPPSRVARLFISSCLFAAQPCFWDFDSSRAFLFRQHRSLPSKIDRMCPFPFELSFNFPKTFLFVMRDSPSFVCAHKGYKFFFFFVSLWEWSPEAGLCPTFDFSAFPAAFFLSAPFTSITRSARRPASAMSSM